MSRMKKSELKSLIEEVIKEETLNEDASDSIAVILTKEAIAKRNPQRLASIISNAVYTTIEKGKKEGIELFPMVEYLQTELKYLLKNLK